MDVHRQQRRGSGGAGVGSKVTGGPIISELLPPEVRVVEARGPIADPYLFPEEAALVSRAVEKRRNEFAAGRACARQALRELGFAAAPILTGDNRQPFWPDGVVGSITHCEGYVAAAVARRSEILSVGIDAEPAEPLPADVIRLIASDRERREIGGLTPSETCWDRVLFSAKESIFKAWFPLMGRWLDFLEARVVLDPVRSVFSAELLAPDPIAARWEGRFRIEEGLVLTALALNASILP